MLAYSVDSAFTQFDWLLSSGNPCTIHLRTKTKCLPFSPIPTVTASDLGVTLHNSCAEFFNSLIKLSFVLFLYASQGSLQDGKGMPR